MFQPSLEQFDETVASLEQLNTLHQAKLKTNASYRNIFTITMPQSDQDTTTTTTGAEDHHDVGRLGTFDMHELGHLEWATADALSRAYSSWPIHIQKSFALAQERKRGGQLPIPSEAVRRLPLAQQRQVRSHMTHTKPIWETHSTTSRNAHVQFRKQLKRRYTSPLRGLTKQYQTDEQRHTRAEETVNDLRRMLHKRADELLLSGTHMYGDQLWRSVDKGVPIQTDTGGTETTDPSLANIGVTDGVLRLISGSRNVSKYNTAIRHMRQCANSPTRGILSEENTIDHAYVYGELTGDTTVRAFAEKALGSVVSRQASASGLVQDLEMDYKQLRMQAAISQLETDIREHTTSEHITPTVDLSRGEATFAPLSELSEKLHKHKNRARHVLAHNLGVPLKVLDSTDTSAWVTHIDTTTDPLFHDYVKRIVGREATLRRIVDKQLTVALESTLTSSGQTQLAERSLLLTPSLVNTDTDTDTRKDTWSGWSSPLANGLFRKSNTKLEKDMSGLNAVFQPIQEFGKLHPERAAYSEPLVANMKTTMQARLRMHTRFQHVYQRATNVLMSTSKTGVVRKIDPELSLEIKNAQADIQNSILELENRWQGRSLGHVGCWANSKMVGIHSGQQAARSVQGRSQTCASAHALPRVNCFSA